MGQMIAHCKSPLWGRGVAARVDGLVVAQGRGGGTGEGEEKTEAEKGKG